MDILLRISVLLLSSCWSNSQVALSSECSSSLGVEHGQAFHISCLNYNHNVPGRCGSCTSVRYNNPVYWCAGYYRGTIGWFQIELVNYQYVSGFAVKSPPGYPMVSVLLSYGFDEYSMVIYGSTSGEVGTIFDVAEDENMIWLEAPVIAKVVRFYAYNEIQETFAVQFELYGCSFETKQDVKAVGMESGLIKNSQIYAKEQSLPNRYENKDTARLNSIFPGYKGSVSGGSSSLSYPETYLQITFDGILKVVSLEAQMIVSPDLGTLYYIITYGIDLTAMRPYTGVIKNDNRGTGAATLPFVKPYDTYKTTKYIFNYPLVSKYIRFTNTHGNYPHCKLEFYAKEYLTESNFWPLQNGVLEDQLSYNHFERIDEVGYEEEGTFINGPMYKPFQSLPFKETDCIINPIECDDGMTFEFEAKVIEPPKGSFLSVTPQSISTHSGSCATSGLDFQNTVAFYFQDIPLQKGASVLDTTTLTGLESSANSVTKLNASVYIMKEESFVTNCDYATGSKPDLSGTVYLNTSDVYMFKNLDILFERIFHHSLWKYGYSFVLVFEPITVADSISIPDDSIFELYISYECFGYTESYINGLDSTRFSEAEASCTGAHNWPDAIRSGYGHKWINCASDENYLEIDLITHQYISMFKVESDPFRWAREFTVEYRYIDQWLKIELQDTTEHIFETIHAGLQYLTLPRPIFANGLRIYPKSYNGSEFSMDFDIVICKTTDDSKTDAVTAQGYEELMISNDEKSWFLFQLNLDTVNCRCVTSMRNNRTHTECDQCPNYNNYVKEMYPNTFSSHVRERDLVGRMTPYQTVFKVDENDHVYALYWNTGRIRTVYPTRTNHPYSTPCVDYFVVDYNHIFCVRYSHDVFVYKDGVESEYAPGSVKQIDYIAASDTLYASTTDNQAVIFNKDTVSWNYISPSITFSCEQIRAGKDGTVWCLSGGMIYEWVPLHNEWVYIPHLVGCTHFDVAKDYVICTDNTKIYRAPRHTLRYQEMSYITPYEPTGTLMVYNLNWHVYYLKSDLTFTHVNAYASTIYSERHQYRDYNRYSTEYTSCQALYEYGLGTSYYKFLCVAPTMISMFGNENAHYSNNGPDVYYWDVSDIGPIDPEIFTVVDTEEPLRFYTMLSSTNEIVYIECEVYYSHVCSIKDIVISDGTNVLDIDYYGNLHMLTSDGNIYDITAPNELKYHSSSPYCTQLKIDNNGMKYCRDVDGFVYVHDYWRWFQIIFDVKCLHFDVNNWAVICGDDQYLYLKSFPNSHNHYNGKSVISSGLQKVYQKTHGTGFEIRYLPSINAFYMNLYDETDWHYVAKFTTNDISAWNHYKFIWDKKNKQLLAYVNSTLVSSHNGYESSISSGEDVPWQNVLLFGSSYDQLGDIEQHIGIRNIKFWDQLVKPEDLQDNDDTHLFNRPSLQILFPIKCKHFTLNETDDSYLCLNQTGGIYNRPSPFISTTSQEWSFYAYNEACVKIFVIYDNLLCFTDSQETAIYVDGDWVLMNQDQESTGTIARSNEPPFFFISYRNTRWHNLTECLEKIAENSTYGINCDGTLYANGYREVAYYNGNYIWRNHGNNLYKGDMGSLTSLGNSGPCAMHTLYVYDDDHIYCRDNDNIVYKFVGSNTWEIAFEKNCSVFYEFNDYYLCVDDNIYIKWKNLKTDAITFSEKITNTSFFLQSENTVIRKSCEKMPWLSGPCGDADTTPEADNKFYFTAYDSDSKSYQDAKKECQKYNGRLAVIESDKDLQHINEDGYNEQWVSNKYNPQTGKPDHHCPTVRRESSMLNTLWRNCDDQIQIQCMANYDQLSLVSQVNFNVSHGFDIGEDSCTVNNMRRKQIASIDNPAINYFVYLFDLNKIGTDTAFTMSNLEITLKQVPFSIDLSVGILKPNFTNCTQYTAGASIQDMLISSHIVNLPLSSDMSETTIKSDDLTKPLTFYKHLVKQTTAVDDDVEDFTVPVIVYWENSMMEPTENDTINIDVEVINLKLAYTERQDSKFLLFPASSLKPHFPPGVLQTTPYNQMVMSLHFSYYMYGNDMGTLYVWLLDVDDVEEPYPAFYAHGNHGSLWQKATIQTPAYNVSWTLLFLAYRTTGPHGDIAIDDIDSSNIPYSNSKDISYTMNGDDNSYLSLLKQSNIPQPLLLFPFKHTFLGNGLINKPLTGSDVMDSQWEDDKYRFPKHALRASDELTFEDFGDVIEFFTDEFSIAFHVKFNFTDSPAVICHFGSGATTLEVSINENILEIKGKDTEYSSAWKFIENTWTYIGITYKNQKLFVYYNNTLDNVTTITTEDEFTPFPDSLSLFKDSSYTGLISCLQVYNTTLSHLEIQAVEFCPDRIEPTTCPIDCKNGGICVPMSKDCICHQTVTRYYDPLDCHNVLEEKFYSDDPSTLYHFDYPNDLLTDSVQLLPSPINYAYCVNDTIFSTQIDTGCVPCPAPVGGNSTNSTEETTEETIECCATGFYLSFWLYVNQLESIGKYNFFTASTVTLSADSTLNKGDPSYFIASIEAAFEDYHCLDSFILPINAWAFFTIQMNGTTMMWTLNGVPSNLLMCNTTQTVTEISNDLEFGGVSKICVDELSYVPLVDAGHGGGIQFDMDRLYKHVSAQPPLWVGYESAVKNSVNFYPSFVLEVTILNKTWMVELENTESYEYDVIKNNVEEMIWDVTYDDSAFMGEIAKVNVTDILLVNGNITVYVSVSIKSFLSEIMSAALKNYNGLVPFHYRQYAYLIRFAMDGIGVPPVSTRRRFNVDSSDVETTLKQHVLTGSYVPIDFPYVPIECELELYDITSFRIKILNVKDINTQYHKGYYIDSTINFVNTDVLFRAETKFYNHGNDIIMYYDAVSFRDYYMKIYSVTHQGYSEVLEAKFTTNMTANVAPPTINMVFAYNISTIYISWDEYTFENWNAPYLDYYILYYKPVSYANHSFNDLSSYTEVYLLPNITEYSINGLEQYREYSIFIATDNRIGISEGMAHVIQRTGEGVPAMAPNIINITTGFWDVTFYWDKIPDDIEIYNSPFLSGYTLSLEAMSPELVSPDCLSATDWVSNATNFTTVEIECTPMQVYRLNISAFTEYGVGVEHVYCFVLQRDVPGQITVFNVSIGPTLEGDVASVFLTVGNISFIHENTVVTYYNITYKAIDFDYTVWQNETVPILHSQEDLDAWEMLNGFSTDCSKFPSPIPSSHIVFDHILPVWYYTNYTLYARACSDEGCSDEFLEAKITTAEHTPLCPLYNVRLFNVSSTELKVTFDEFSHDCISGRLKYHALILFETIGFLRLRESHSLEEIRNISIDNNWVNKTKETEFIFPGLEEYINYTVIAYAVNGAGVGIISQPVFNLTEEDIPVGGPNNCQVKNINSTAFNLTFNEPDYYTQNGLLSYQILIFNHPYEELVEYIIPYEGSNEIFAAGNLSEYTNHTIMISPFTKYGTGPNCTLQTRTMEDVPSLPPQDFTIVTVTNDTVDLSWDNIPERSVNGRFLYYQLKACGNLRNGSNHCYTKYITKYNYTLTVFPATWYYFSLSGCTMVDGGRCGVNHTIWVLTKEMKPSGVVQNLHVTEYTANSLNITWDPVPSMQQRGNITFYNITVESVPALWFDPENITFNETFERVPRHLLVNGLNNYTVYEVTVTAFTLPGAGPVTDIHLFRTLENHPSAAPTNVTGVDYSSSALNVSWIPIQPSQHEGVLLGHYVSYISLQNCSFTGEYSCGSEEGYFNCSGGGNTSCIVSGLSLNMTYEIRISGYTSVGYGPWSDPVNATTGDYIDGGWSNFTDWGSCDRSCGLGKKMRQRWCTNPIPQNGGKECPMEERYEFKPCNDFPCSGYYFSEIGESCTETCSKISSDFTCAPRHDYQNTSRAFEQTLDIVNHTIFINTECNSTNMDKSYELPSDPRYNVMENACKGFYNIPNLMNCTAVAPENDKRLCRCQTFEDALFEEWAPWSFCTKECGTGSNQRFRDCLYDDLSMCLGGKIKDENDCNIDPCPIDGVWGEWSKFSNCTAPCGDAVRIRRRSCNNPAPLYNGTYCPGTNVDIDFNSCEHYPCPVDGNWGEWQELDECLHSCGEDSYRYQFRSCDNPPPDYGGADCEGDIYRTYPCADNQPCKPTKFTVTIRYHTKEWETFEMYRLDHPLTLNFSQTAIQQMKQFYHGSEKFNTTQEIVINMIAVKKGSVIGTFEIEYPQIPSSEFLLLQHELEEGSFQGELVTLQNIATTDAPGLPPLKVNVSSTTPFTINTSWDFITNLTTIHGQLYLYQVFYRRLNGTPEETKWENVGTQNNSIVLKRLIPGTWYGIRIVPSNEGGNGVASPLMKIQTIEGVPYIKPPNCFRQVLDERTVFFSWDHIPTYEIPGTLKSYQIKYRQYFGTEWTRIGVPARKSMRTVVGFLPYTWYWVEIAGNTSAGEGPSHLFVFQTPPGPPSLAPPNATLHDRISTTEMIVTWDAIPEEYQNGDLQGYMVFYRKCKQGGIEDKAVSFDNCTLDKFTFSCKMIGLESYTQYEIFLYGYNVYGNGPEVYLYGDTCKCPKYIFTNWYAHAPYTKVSNDLSYGTQATGLFPDILEMVIGAVCVDCKTYTPTLFYNLTRNGRKSMKRDEKQLKLLLDDGVDISFPVYGQFNLDIYAGLYPYLGFVESQGSAMIIYQARTKVIGLVGILNAVVIAWPVILIAVLMAMISGWILWMLEQPIFEKKDEAEETDITNNKSIYGAYEGFWLSFISMTTLGYGDLCPSSKYAKSFMVLWVLIGLNIVSIFGGAVSSGMSVGSMDKEYKLYGTTVAAVKNTFEEMIAIRRNAIVSNFTTISHALQAVNTGAVELALVDATSLQPYVDMLDTLSLSVYRIMDFDSGFGTILSGEFSRVESDMRSFVSAKQADISKFVEERVGILTPNVVEIEEILLSPEESQEMLTLLVIIYHIMAIIGILVWRALLMFKDIQKNKVSPEDKALMMLNEFNKFDEIVHEFNENIDSVNDELLEKHMQQRYTLYLQKTSYDRNLRRVGRKEEFQLDSI